jgi:protein kinase C substrate 80K-H
MSMERKFRHWGKWSGPDSDKFSAQLYDKGQSCWNGPERSTKVEIQCGEQLQLVEASEPSKCEYKFVLKAPAACRNPEEVEREHQEL